MPKKKDVVVSSEVALIITPSATIPAENPTAGVRAVGQRIAHGAAVTAAAVGSGLATGGAKVSQVAGAGSKVAVQVGHQAALLVGDLNGDGKVDEADLAIFRAKAGHFTHAAAREAGEFGKAVARHDMTKDAAAGAAIGALIAVPIPFVGPVAGAAAGAAVGVLRGGGPTGLVTVAAKGVGAATKAAKRPRARARPRPKA